MAAWDLFLLAMVGGALGLAGSAFAKANHLEQRLSKLEKTS
jgi:hypothetical protein